MRFRIDTGLCALALAAALAGCPKQDVETGVVPGQAVPGQAQAGAAGSGTSEPALTYRDSQGLPDGHPPTAGQPSPGPVRPGSVAPDDATHSGLREVSEAMQPPPAAQHRFEAPEDWLSETPRTSMRLAQYRLPKQADDEADGELAVFFFGGAAGGVQKNIDRWYSQWETGDDSPKDVAKLDRLAEGPLPITLVELSGTYIAETQPGSGERVNKPGHKLLGAIAEGQDGNYFIKAVGPEATMNHWRESFRAFAQSFR